MSDEEYARILAAEFKAAAQSVPKDVYEQRLLRGGVHLGLTDLDEIRAREDEIYLEFAKAFIEYTRMQHGETNYLNTKREATRRHRAQSGESPIP